MATFISDANQYTLLKLARNIISNGCTDGVPPKINLQHYPDHLKAVTATFVTLKKQGELRGCIGTLTAQNTLLEDIVHNAFSSAFRDPRFPPVTKSELHTINIEISVLSPMQPINVETEQELLDSLVPYTDGLLIEGEHHKATFLPQVWEQLPRPEDFLLRLKHKAGLRDGEWPDNMRCFRYHCIKFGEVRKI